MGPRTRFAARMLADPPAREYRPVLRGLIGAVLAFEHPRFPTVSSAQVEVRLLQLFPVDAGEQFAAFQRGLTYFDEIDLFPELFGPLIRAEGGGDRPAGLAAAQLEMLRAGERDRYARFRATLEGSPARFSELPLEHQRSYLRMWSASGLGAKRQFARSAKSLVMVSAYSMEEMWRAMGYGGPLLEGGRVET